MTFVGILLDRVNVLRFKPIFHWKLGLRWGNANFRFGIGSNTHFSVFRYQHVGIPNAKLWRWGSEPTQGLNANGFASQWNNV